MEAFGGLRDAGFQLGWMRRTSGPFKAGFETAVLREVVKHRRTLALMTLGVVGYSVGHAALAVSAGLLGRSLAADPAAFPGETALGPWGGSMATLCYVGLGAAFVKTVAAVGLAHSETILGARIANGLRAHLVALLLHDGSALPAPRLLAALAVRLREVENAVVHGVLKSLRAAVQLVPLFFCCLVISSRLTIGATFVVFPFALGLAALRRRARRASESAQSQVEALERGVDELVRNTDLFRTYGAGQRILAAIERAGEAAAGSSARVERGRAALSGSNELIAVLAVLGAAALSARLGSLRMTAALVPFSAVFFMAYRPLRDLGDARSAVARGAVARDAIEQAVAPPRDSAPAAPEPSWRRGAPLGLELVRFGAADRGPTLSLEVAPGAVVGIAGRTGAGKTTLLRALLGLEAARGALRLGGVDVTHAEVGPRARPFGWVPQEAPLVTGTLAQNVALLGGDEARAAAALVAVGAARLAAVATTEVVGPAARPLSGGERRQVALARALATDLPVLLLDEPTEGLDAEASAAVLAAIAGLRGQRTVLVVTHRADVLAVCDRVVRLDEARLDEASTP